MTIKWTPDGKVDRKVRTYGSNQPDFNTLADALDECVAALRAYGHGDDGRVARAVLRKLGVEP